MAEVIVLKKGSSKRTIRLDVAVLRVKIGQRKETRTAYLTGVMARAKRDAMVAELHAAGWTSEPPTKRKSPKKARVLAFDDLVVGPGKPKSQEPGDEHEWPPGYAEFARRFGAGDLEGLVIFDPKARTKRTKEWAKVVPHLGTLFPNVREHFPCGDEGTLVVVAASENGDIVGFPSSRPTALYLFPRGSNTVIGMGTSWGEALATWCYGEHIAPCRVDGRDPRFRPSTR